MCKVTAIPTGLYLCLSRVALVIKEFRVEVESVAGLNCVYIRRIGTDIDRSDPL